MELFKEALEDGTITGFFKLVEQYRTQTEPAFCGLTTLAMVLNALSIDPRRTWKAPWRWFDETLLDCCKPLPLVKVDGLCMNEVACLARCNGAKVTMHTSGSFQLSTFRELIKSSSKSIEQHIIVSYSRKAFHQTGDGHFSPIGGYHEKSDHALILDTATFKYPPHWVPLSMLYSAMERIDPISMKPRGFLLMRAPDRPVSVCYTLNRTDNWQEAEQFVRSVAPEILKDMALSGALSDAILKTWIDRCPLESVQKFVAVRFNGCCCEGTSSPIHSEPFREEFEKLPLYQRIREYLEERGVDTMTDAYLVGRVTVLLLLKPASLWLDFEVAVEIRTDLEELMDLTRYSLVKTEMAFLRHQMENLVAIEEIQTHNCNCKTHQDVDEETENNQVSVTDSDSCHIKTRPQDDQNAVGGRPETISNGSTAAVDDGGIPNGDGTLPTSN